MSLELQFYQPFNKIYSIKMHLDCLQKINQIDRAETVKSETHYTSVHTMTINTYSYTKNGTKVSN